MPKPRATPLPAPFYLSDAALVPSLDEIDLSDDTPNQWAWSLSSKYANVAASQSPPAAFTRHEAVA